jgi:membrane-associated phospholipid phosphatase
LIKNFVFVFIACLGLQARADGLGYQIMDEYKQSARLLGDRESLTILGSGVAAVFAARLLDEEAQEHFSHQHRLGSLEEIGNDYLGTGVPGILLAGGFWVAGASFENEKAIRAGRAQFESLTATFVATSILKGIGGRERPDGSDRYSFPSGHTSTVFASASVLSRFYGWKAGVPAYFAGVVTALSRVSENRHWLSDTVSGALVGELIGQAIARAHLAQMQGDAADFTILPMLPFDGEDSRRGLAVRFAY